MPTVNCSAFTASNVGRLLRRDCRYWTVDFEVWSALIVTWAAGVAIHATFQNRHFRPPKIRELGLGRTEEKFADSDANSESAPTVVFEGWSTLIATWAASVAIHASYYIKDRRHLLRPISIRSDPIIVRSLIDVAALHIESTPLSWILWIKQRIPKSWIRIYKKNSEFTNSV